MTPATEGVSFLPLQSRVVPEESFKVLVRAVSFVRVQTPPLLTVGGRHADCDGFPALTAVTIITRMETRIRPVSP